MYCIIMLLDAIIKIYSNEGITNAVRESLRHKSRHHFDGLQVNSAV